MTALSMPLHPLFVHGAVVFLPLAALTSIFFVGVRSFRWVLRWPALVTNVLSLVFLMASRLTGDPLAHDLRARGASQATLDLIEKHDQLAGLLTIATFPLVAATAVAWWIMPATTPLPSGAGGSRGRFDKLQFPLMAITVLLAFTVILLTVLTGDAGAKAVWSS